MKYELQLQMNFRSAFGELKRQTKDNVSCSDSRHSDGYQLYFSSRRLYSYEAHFKQVYQE